MNNEKSCRISKLLYQLFRLLRDNCNKENSALTHRSTIDTSTCSRRRRNTNHRNRSIDSDLSSMDNTKVSPESENQCVKSSLHCVGKTTSICTKSPSLLQGGDITTKAAFSSQSTDLTCARFRSKKQGYAKNNIITTRFDNKFKMRSFWLLLLFLVCESSICNARPSKRDIKTVLPDLHTYTENTYKPTFTDDYVWQTWIENTPQSGAMPSRRRSERAAKRGVSSPFLTLYSRSSYFLEISSNGKVRGTTNQNSAYNILTLTSTSVGVIAIYGVKSKRFLAMNRRGKLYGSEVFNDECKFLEKMEGDGRGGFTYEAMPKKRRKQKKTRFVGFDKNGKVKKGHRIKKNNKGALFAKISTTRKIGGGKRRG